jgi:hypothetical protein
LIKWRAQTNYFNKLALAGIFLALLMAQGAILASSQEAEGINAPGAMHSVLDNASANETDLSDVVVSDSITDEAIVENDTANSTDVVAPATVQEATTADALGLFSISGMKYNDLNGNGSKDKGESGIAGWIIDLTVEGETAVTVKATTDSSGTYKFDNVSPGNYIVSEEPQEGWISTNNEPSRSV